MKKILTFIFILNSFTIFADTPDYMEGTWITEDGTESWDFEKYGISSDPNTYPDAIFGFVTVTDIESGYSQYYSYHYKHDNFFIQWTYDNFYAYIFSKQMDGDILVPRAQYVETDQDLIAPRTIREYRHWTIEKRILQRME